MKLLSGITDPTYQWYANDTAISGATAQSYTHTAADIGKTLSVKVTPNAASGYAAATVAAKNAVEAHKYSSNGFCTVCEEYQPAIKASGTYQITNGGQLFWFAALVNGDGAHAVFPAKDAAAQLTPGGYNGNFVVLYYQPDTHEKTIVNTEIPVNITVVQ